MPLDAVAAILCARSRLTIRATAAPAAAPSANEIPVLIRERLPGRLDAYAPTASPLSASSSELTIVKTPSRPVIRKVLTIASLEHTITSEPSSRRRRRCAPISTPSDDESMNVVSVRSTTTCVRPSSIGADTRCLNSGAVNRSISPATDTMCVSASTERSSIAKAMAIADVLPRPGPFRILVGGLVRRAGIFQTDVQELLLALRSHAHLVRELLDDVADARNRGVDDQRVPTTGAQWPDAQRQRARAGLEGHVDRRAQHVRGGAGGDQVSHQDRVVEAVQGQVGARGEHAHDATQDRPHKRAGGD